MNRCPITYVPCGSQKYSEEAAALFDCDKITDFPYSQSQQLELALESADKLSIQGVQSKLSAIFDHHSGTFKPVVRNGMFILKLQHKTFPEIPQNEDLTMRLAKTAGIEVPLHGLIYGLDGSVLYFIQRFDRGKESKVQHLGTLAKSVKKRKILHKISVEDFAQLVSLSRDTKYDFSMEKIIPIIEKFCTFPLTEKKKLFRLTLFSFLVGNEDLHLKNFSLIRHAELTEFSPAYDLVNSTIATKSKEELALPLRGKKSHFSKEDLISYYGREKLQLPLSVLEEVLSEIETSLPQWKELIRFSFLSESQKKAYLDLVQERVKRIFKT
jgi:serine/threonine-protein kinase HipA